MKSLIIPCIGLLLISFVLISQKNGMKGTGDMIGSNTERSSTQREESLMEYADTILIEIKTKGIELSYSIPEIRAKAGSFLRIRYSNESDMSHNIVFVKGEEDIRPVGIAALQAQSTEWVPAKEMHRIIAYSKLAHSGEKVEFTFKVPAPGTYPFICTYSAHWTQMQGRLISVR